MKAIYANKHNILNAVLFQLCWFAAILGEWYLALFPLALMFVVALGFLGVSQPGWSIVVGPNAGSNPQSYLLYHSTTPNYELTLTEISFDAGGPYWNKNLLGQDAQGQNRPVLEIGDTITLVEHIKVIGDSPWTDWHEIFMSDGMSWVDGNIVYTGGDTPIDGLSYTISRGPGEAVHYNNIDFFFTALLPGTEIDIIKTMVWEGLDVITSNPISFQLGTDIIVIRQSPTYAIPEPMTLSLLAVGGGLLGFLRRRRTV